MEDRPDGEVALKVFEGFFDADEQQVQIPQLGGVVFGEIGAQEIAPLAPARPSQPIAVEVVGKGDARRRYRDDDQAPRGWGMPPIPATDPASNAPVASKFRRVV